MRRWFILVPLAAAVVLVAPATAGDRRRPSGVTSADARLRPGSSATLLRVHGLGRWTAACSKDGQVSVALTADHLLPTSDLVVARTAGAPLARRLDAGERVTPEPPGTVLSQRWQIAPFAAAQVQVTAASVAGRTTGDGCAASVVVLTGPDQGPTITR